MLVRFCCRQGMVWWRSDHSGGIFAGGEGISAVPGDEGVRLGFGGDPGGLTEVQDDAVRVEDGGDDA